MPFGCFEGALPSPTNKVSAIAGDISRIDTSFINGTIINCAIKNFRYCVASVDNLAHAPTQVVSFLFVDLVAYSKESTAGQQKIKATLITYLKTAMAPISATSYRVRDTGDGAVVAFTGNPEQPLYAALALWQTCERGNDPALLPFKRLRVGVHIGTVKEVPDVEGRANYVGDGVNSAKRVQDLADPGQILASRSFFEAMAHLDTDYSSLFEPAGAGDDKHGRSHELFALHFEQAAFEKLTHEVQQGTAVTNKTKVDKGAVGQIKDFIKEWFIPVNAILFSTTFYISSVGKVANQTQTLRYSGIFLLVFSVLVGTASWGMARTNDAAFETRFPRLTRFIHYKPLTLLAFILGVMLFGVSWFLSHSSQQSSESTPAASTRTVFPANAPVGVSLPQNLSAPTQAPPLASVPAEPALAQLPTSAQPIETPAVDQSQAYKQQTPAPVKVPSASTQLQRVKPASEGRTSGASAKCTRLLEQVGSGEPLSSQQQKEMETLCR